MVCIESCAAALCGVQGLQKENLLLYAAAALAVREVKRVLRRVSAEDTPEERHERKRLVGIAAKAIHANPLSALEPPIAQVTPHPPPPPPLSLRGSACACAAQDVRRLLLAS